MRRDASSFSLGRAALGRALSLAGWGGVTIGLLLSATAGGEPRAAEPPLPDSPYRVLGSRVLDTPVIDAFAVCLPENLDRELGEIVEAAAGAEFESALEALEAKEPEPGTSPPTAWLRLAAILRGRLATDVRSLRAARRDLDTSLAIVGGAKGERPCGRLELARVELLLGLLPEARVNITRALRAVPERELPGDVRARARFYRAEALHLAGDFAESRALQTRLEGSSQLIPALRLRAADRDFSTGRYKEAAEAYEKLFEAGVLGAPAPGWAARVGEAALLAGNLDSANYWLGVARDAPDSARVALIDIRRADLRYVQGNLSDARRLLETVARKNESEPVGELAGLRLLSLDLAGGSLEGQLESLRKASRVQHPGVAVHARALLLHRLIESVALDEAMEVMAQLAYDSPDAAAIPGLSKDLDALLVAVAGGADEEPDCPSLLQRLGSRRALFLAHAHVSEPFLRLGDCYVSGGMASVGVEVYRSVTARFGAQRAEVVALRMARAALETGDLETARAAGEARADRGGPGADPWVLLLAEVELREGRSEAVVGRLFPLVAEGRPEGRLARALRTLARAAVDREPTQKMRRGLHLGLSRIPDPVPQRDVQDVGEAALYTAELHRLGGEPRRARVYYERAVSLLPDGAVRAQAAYWQGTLERGREEALAAWEIAADSSAAGAWSRLAKNEIRMNQIRREVGRRRAVPRASSPASPGP